MSFTSGGLFRQESVDIAALYKDLGSWEAVREKAVKENLLKLRTVSSGKRLVREIVARLQVLDMPGIELLVEGHRDEQVQLLWIAVCRLYKFVAEFAISEVRERFISLKSEISHADFDSFYFRKSEWHEELDAMSDSTRLKLRQVIFRMLRDADLIAENNMILPAVLAPRVIDFIRECGGSDFVYFPVFEDDLRRLLK